MALCFDQYARHRFARNDALCSRLFSQCQSDKLQYFSTPERRRFIRHGKCRFSKHHLLQRHALVYGTVFAPADRILSESLVFSKHQRYPFQLHGLYFASNHSDRKRRSILNGLQGLLFAPSRFSSVRGNLSALPWSFVGCFEAKIRIRNTFDCTNPAL